MSLDLIPHDEHVYTRQYFLNNDISDIEPLSVERARQWLEYPTWTRHEAILILAGDDPESRRYYEADGMAGNLRAVVLDGLGGLPADAPDRRPFGEYLAWAKEHRQTLPDALMSALAGGVAPVVSGTRTQAAPQAELVVAEPEPMPAIKKEGYVLKKAAAIKKYSSTWTTIESDLNHANDNGLTDAAKATKHGDWYENALLAWADQRGKRTEPMQQAGVVNSVFKLHGIKHTLKG